MNLKHLKDLSRILADAGATFSVIHTPEGAIESIKKELKQMTDSAELIKVIDARMTTSTYESGRSIKEFGLTIEGIKFALHESA